MGKRKTIVCLETGKQFNSVENAANAIGVSSGFISRQIKAGKPIKGFHYYYAGEMLPDEYRQKIRNQKKTAVRCLETGKMYESIADASRDTGINHNSIRSVARGDRHKAGGYTWEYVNPAPDKRDNRGCNQPTAKKVRCAETGNQFVSLSDAARAVGLRNGNSIRRAIDRGGTAGGYHWEYLDEKRR